MAASTVLSTSFTAWCFCLWASSVLRLLRDGR
jgi:hypothetical protein